MKETGLEEWEKYCKYNRIAQISSKNFLIGKYFYETNEVGWLSKAEIIKGAIDYYTKQGYNKEYVLKYFYSLQNPHFFNCVIKNLLSWGILKKTGLSSKTRYAVNDLGFLEAMFTFHKAIKKTQGTKDLKNGFAKLNEGKGNGKTEE